MYAKQTTQGPRVFYKTDAGNARKLRNQADATHGADATAKMQGWKRSLSILALRPLRAFRTLRACVGCVGCKLEPSGQTHVSDWVVFRCLDLDVKLWSHGLQ